MNSQTRMWRLAERMVGEPLEPWIVARRAQGKSWQAISDDILAASEGVLHVHRETLRTWFKSDTEAEAS